MSKGNRDDQPARKVVPESEREKYADQKEINRKLKAESDQEQWRDVITEFGEILGLD